MTELLERKVDVETRNGFELIERAAGVAETAPADHGHGEAAGGNDGRQDQRGLVADAAGGVLVHFFAGEIGEIQNFAGIAASPR